jgi:hypothetical protein
MTAEDSRSDNVDVFQALVVLAQGLADAKRAIDESPQIQRLRADLQRLAAGLKECVAVVRLDPRVAEFLAKLPEWHAHLEANQLLLDQAMARLRDSPYQAVWHLFRLSDVLPFAGLNQEEIGVKFYEHTASQVFRDELIQLYERTALPAGRVHLIRDALDLHSTRKFAGCITLLYSQIEGTIGDALVLIGKATRGPDGALLSVHPEPRKLVGIQAKLDVAQAEEPDTIYSALLGECLVADSIAVRFAPSRNAVLHGSDLIFATQDRSTQLVLWLAALIVRMADDSRMSSNA